MKNKASFFPFSKKNSDAFTLIELLVVISIITLIFTIVMFNYRAAEKQFALQRSAHKLTQDIRSAQSMAMVTREIEGIVPEGYGIYLTNSSNQYILFADLDGDGLYNENIDLNLNSGRDPLRFETGVFVSNLSANPLHIAFYPPDPTILISGAPENTLALIYLNYEGGSGKIIRVNKVGLIEVE